MVEVPDAFAAGVTVTVREAPEPPNTMLAFGTSAGLLDEPDIVSEAAAVSTSATVKARTPVGVSSVVNWSVTSLIVGASLTALTVSTNVSDELLVPSLTEIVMVEVPDRFAAGVAVRVRFAPEPPNAGLPFGTSAGLDDVAVTVRAEAAVST